MSNCVYVLAGTAEQARRWARDNELQPHQWKFVSDIRSIAGAHEPVMFRIGTWYERKDGLAIWEKYTIDREWSKP